FEISLIACYQLIIWSYYFHHHSLTVPFIFGSFLLISLVETIGLAILAYTWYSTLPIKPSIPVKTISSSLIIKNRLFSYSHSMGKQLFSANVLVPLFAYF